LPSERPVRGQHIRGPKSAAPVGSPPGGADDARGQGALESRLRVMLALGVPHFPPWGTDPTATEWTDSVRTLVQSVRRSPRKSPPSAVLPELTGSVRSVFLRPARANVIRTEGLAARGTAVQSVPLPPLSESLPSPGVTANAQRLGGPKCAEGRRVPARNAWQENCSI